ncbi:ubiquitin-like-conjugating enzyme ATG3 [Chironomus tepperi]|uniref:ubiquitin-like-conjugating enzyme ATG3 n=1 Tax=Chironomus tepperi TaxID=113505 RepID=UPI00391F517C
MDVFNKIKSTSLSVAEIFTPVLKESKFKESGRITPEEFVAAGDHLVHMCRTWNWSSGDESKIKSYLPADKQYLVTKNVPCTKRCRQMTEFSCVEKIVEEAEGEDGWVTHENDENDINDSVAEMTLECNKLDEQIEKEANAQDEEEEAVDMEDFEESGMLENIDPSVAIVKPTSSASEDPSNEVDSVVHCRSYDLHIVYNKYYQTPHLFLIGYDENKKLLSVDEMFEDVSQDNAKKTVTFEQHPHLGPSMLAVHPCRHGDLMKKFIQIAEDGGNELSVHSYLIIFLKFVQSVIPTVNYDFSQTIKTN